MDGTIFSVIKSKYSLESEIEKTHKLVNGKMKCPFHEDNDPSFHIWKNGEEYKCFGCGEWGDVIDWIAYIRNISNSDAFKELARECNIISDIPVPTWAKRLRSYIDRCHDEMMKKSSECYDYAKQFYSDDTLNKWRIGIGLKPTKEEQRIGVLPGTKRGFEGRLIYPVLQGNIPMNLIGRYPSNTLPNEIPKSLNMGGREVTPFNEHRLFGNEVTITEGPKDCIMLEEQGHKACALISMQKSGWEVGEKTEVRLCFDSDQSGHDASLKHGERLYRKKNRVYIVSLPSGKDPADVALEFNDYSLSARPFIDSYIDNLDWNPDQSYKYDDNLKTATELIKAGGSQNGAIRYLKDKSGESGGGIKDALNNAGDENDMEPIWTPHDPKFFRPAMYWDFDTRLMTYMVRIRVARGLAPFLMDSNKNMELFNKEDLFNKGYIYTGELPSNVSVPRWSIGTDHKHGVHGFMNGAPPVESTDIFNDIKSLIDTYIRYPDPMYSTVLTLFIMNTYVYMIHETTPYIWLHAMKQSGKTNTLLILDALCFNAWFSSSVTESALSRELNANQSTAIIDEAENLVDDTTQVLQTLNSGYKKGPAAHKSVKPEGGDWQPAQFYSYGPKAFASISPINNVLADRSITLHLRREEGDIKPLEMQTIGDLVKDIRNRLYCWGMQHAGALSETPPLAIQGLDSRLREMWHPLMVIASGISSDLLEQVKGIFYERKEYKSQQDDLHNREKAVFHSIIHYMKEHRRWSATTARDWYSTVGLVGAASEEYSKKFSPREMYTIIFDLLKIADIKDDRGRKRIDSNPYPVVCIRLEKSVVEERAASMFGMQIDWEGDDTIIEESNGEYVFGPNM